MGKKVISQRKKLAAVFASFAILIMGTVSLMESMSLDYYSVLGTLEKVIPAGFILGGIGWVMGMILDRPPKRQKINYGNIMMSEALKNHFSEETSAETEENKSEEQPQN